MTDVRSVITGKQIVVDFDLPDYIGRVANALDVGASAEDIHTLLYQECLTEEDIYLTYIAGKLLHESRKLLPPKPASKIRRIVSTQIG